MKTRVLLVEDERLTRELVMRMLNTIGISHIVDVRSGEAAWEALVGKKRQVFHVMISDLSLPGVSGTGLIKGLRALPFPSARALPVIVLTGDDRLETFKALEPLNVARYLVKPISPALLRDSITRALGWPVTNTATHALEAVSVSSRALTATEGGR